jgi:hypothetical protein
MPGLKRNLEAWGRIKKSFLAALYREKSLRISLCHLDDTSP